jgi:hypothetical protein
MAATGQSLFEAGCTGFCLFSFDTTCPVVGDQALAGGSSPDVYRW